MVQQLLLPAVRMCLGTAAIMPEVHEVTAVAWSLTSQRKVAFSIADLTVELKLSKPGCLG